MAEQDKPQLLNIKGMHCSSCVARIEAALNTIPGVKKVSVNFIDNSAMVYGNVAANKLITAIAGQGYAAELQSTAFSENKDKTQAEYAHFKQMLQRFVVAGVFGFGLMLADWLNILPAINQARYFWLPMALITLLVIIYAGRNFYLGAAQAFIHRKANMDTLIALGTGAAWLYSTLVILMPDFIPSIAQHAYFAAAMIIIALINLGQGLEMRAKGKTSQAIQRLIGLQPKTARIIRDGKEINIPIEAVKLNDLVRVRPGEKIAVDGVVMEGDSYVDESMLSGESMPVHKQIKSEVAAGTLNQAGTLLLQATRIGEETALARIIDLVKQAQGSKPAIGRLVDKVAGVFVPIVIGIAIIASVFWYFFGPTPALAYAIIIAMTVLLIACPCALGLATPISIMLGIGKAAEHGILIRNGEALHKASKLSAIVLDKTGTITEGKPSVEEIVAADSWDEKKILQYAASVEAVSEHPLALAVIKAAEKNTVNKLPIKNFQMLVGMGVTAEINEQAILLGNEKLMQQHNVKIGALATQLEDLKDKGKTIVLLAVANQLVGLITIADAVKSDAKLAIRKMRQAGLAVYMITGDNRITAQDIAKEVGIDHVLAEVSPADKAGKVAELQSHGKIVGMVGDGINDAPALAKADVGFAIGAGTDVAIESADVTLMRNSLMSVVEAVKISQATMKNIKQNLFGAFIYNVLGIPIAAGIVYPFTGWLLNPLIAGTAMALSSLTVVLNAGRLRFFDSSKKN